MARKIKGIRKKKSLYNRKMVLKMIRVSFQKAYNANIGTPQARLEGACQTVDKILLDMSNTEPQKTSFFNAVKNDFKELLMKIADNEKIIKQAVEASKPLPGEVGSLV